MEVPRSEIFIPINVPVSELKQGVNRSLKRVLFEGGVKLNSKGDSLFLKIERSRPLDLQLRKEKLWIAAPVKVSAVMQKKVFGVMLSNADQPVVFSGVANMNADLDLDDTWDLNLSCRWLGFDWETSPVIEILGLRLNLQDILDEKIADLSDYFESTICLQLQDQMALQSRVQNTYQKITETQPLRASPIPISLQFDLGSLDADLTLSKQDTLLLGAFGTGSVSIRKQQNELSKILPNRLGGSITKSSSVLFANVLLELSDLDSVLSLNAQNRSFSYNDMTVTIRKLGVSHDNGFLVFLVDFTGDQSGTVRIQAVPNYQSGKLYLDQLSYELVDGSQLLQVADAAAHSAVIEYLESMLTYEIPRVESQLEERIAYQKSQLPHPEKFDLSLQVDALRLYGRGITDSQLQLIFQLDARVELTMRAEAFQQ